MKILLLKISFLLCIILGYCASEPVNEMVPEQVNEMLLEQVNQMDSDKKFVTNFNLPEILADSNAEHGIKPNSLLTIAMLTSQRQSDIISAQFEADLNQVLPLIKKLVDRACQNIAVQEKWKNEAEKDPEFYYKYSAIETELDNQDQTQYDSTFGLIKEFTAAEFEYIDTIEAFTLLKNTLKKQPRTRYKYLQIDSVPEFYQGAVFTIQWNFHHVMYTNSHEDNFKVYFSLKDYEYQRRVDAMEVLIEEVLTREETE